MLQKSTVQELHIFCGYSLLGRYIWECTPQDVVYVVTSLLVPTKGPWTTSQLGWPVTALRVPGAEPCVPKWKGKLPPWLLHCSLFHDSLGGGRRSYLAPLSASFPMNWHLPFLSYLPARLWPVLLLTLILFLPKAGLATEAENVPLSLSLCNGPWNVDCSCFGA